MSNELCKCGRPECRRIVPPARGKKLYATDECAHYVKLLRERERKRKELKMVRDLLPEKKVSKYPTAQLYCSKCGQYRDHRVKGGVARCESCGREKAAP